MKYALIRGTDMRAGKIVLGTDMFGSDVSQKDAFYLIDMFLDAGGNLLDTAKVYADWKTEVKSASEKTIGAWLKQHKRRDTVLISTKGGHPFLSSMQVPRLSRTEIMGDLEDSLRHLGTDYVDMYWLHRDNEKMPAGELCEIMNDILRSGKARGIGVSNWRYARIQEANRYAASHGLVPFRASQLQYSIARVNAGALQDQICALTPEEYAGYAQDDINVFAFSSQAKGFFSLMEQGGEAALPERVFNEYRNPYNLALFDRLHRFAAEKGVPIATAALAVLTDDPAITCFAQISTTKANRLKDVLSGADFTVTPEERKKLLSEEK